MSNGEKMAGLKSILGSGEGVEILTQPSRLFHQGGCSVAMDICGSYSCTTLILAPSRFHLFNLYGYLLTVVSKHNHSAFRAGS